jgi:septal ring factor EnvC (AmiA/AmiB activator)
MKPLLLLLLLLLPQTPPTRHAQGNPATAGLERQHAQTLDDIQLTSQLLSKTTRNEKNALNRLALLANQIDARKRLIVLADRQLLAFDTQLDTLARQLALLRRQLDRSRSAYTRSLRIFQQHRSSYDKLLFILAAPSAPQSLRRMRYLSEYAQWQKQQALRIATQQHALDSAQHHLLQVRQQHQLLLQSHRQQSQSLLAEQALHKKESKLLSRRKTQLQAQLRRQQQQAQALNRQIEKLIAQEAAQAAKAAKAAADASKTVIPAKAGTYAGNAGPAKAGSSPTAGDQAFINNKGRLPLPLDSKCAILRPFGEQQHHDFKHIRTVNNGVDFQTLPGANARAIFAGQVSRIFAVPGFNNSVILRHGSFLSVYSNLDRVFVRPGQSISALQPLGRIYSDPDAAHETILHFQLRHEKEKLNPLLWLSPY